MFGVRNVEESPEEFHFKCLNASLSLCLCCKSPALASVEEDGCCKSYVELKLDLEITAIYIFNEVKVSLGDQLK